MTGLLVLVVALGIPVLISGAWYVLFLDWWRWSSPDRSPHLPLLAMVISILVAVYALALTTICLVRVTIYAAILSVGVLAGGMSLAWFFLGEESAHWSMTDWATTITAMMSVAAVLATLVGWWAVRRNIGWKQ